MQQRQLCKNGPKVSALGFGAWPIASGMGEVGEDTAIRAVHTALERGITLIDTAQGYRSSERILGKALQGGYRERCFLATKVSGDYKPEAITAAMENSLQALKVDHVDLYQIHFWHTDEQMAAAMETMFRLQEECKTRFIGVSNFDVGQMQEAIGTAPIQTNQLQYTSFTPAPPPTIGLRSSLIAVGATSVPSTFGPHHFASMRNRLEFTPMSVRFLPNTQVRWTRHGTIYSAPPNSTLGWNRNWVGGSRI